MISILFCACGRKTLRGFFCGNPRDMDNGARGRFGDCAEAGESLAIAEKIENFLFSGHKYS